MPSTPQLQLMDDLGNRYTVIRPMFDVVAWRSFTGLGEDALKAECTAGNIRFAFHIEGARAKRWLIRFWNRSLICYLKPNLDQPADLASALYYILPHQRETLRCSELCRALNVGGSHILNLLEGGLLTRAPMHETHPASSPLVTRSSVVQLLTERRIK